MTRNTLSPDFVSDRSAAGWPPRQPSELPRWSSQASRGWAGNSSLEEVLVIYLALYLVLYPSLCPHRALCPSAEWNLLR